MKKFGYSFEVALYAIYLALETYDATHEESCVIKYSELVVRPEEEIFRVARYLNIRPTTETVQEIADQTSIKSVRQAADEISSLPPERVGGQNGDLFDKLTHIHQGHITNTGPNEWRDRLTNKQIALLLGATGRWIAKLGYEDADSLAGARKQYGATRDLHLEKGGLPGQSGHWVS